MCCIKEPNLSPVYTRPGTFITEWEPGKAVCEALLASKETVTKAVNKLKRIALFYGFEGWLINIENEIHPEKVSACILYVCNAPIIEFRSSLSVCQ